jgi:hypothetical protein
MTIMEDSLITSKIPTSDHHSLYPGENLFLYWKTSSSLWESKLALWPKQRSLSIPVNWSLHHIAPNRFDFGQERPETDLLRLLTHLQAGSFNFHLALPLGPFPMMANGGVPSFLASDLVAGEDKTGFALLDSQDNILKLFTFYNPELLQQRQLFLRALIDYLKEHRLNAPIYGVDAGYMQGPRFVSFMEDYSSKFELGFKRYLSKMHPAIEKRNELPFDELENLKSMYHEEIKKLYQTIASDSLGEYWYGSYRQAFLGAKPEDLWRRVFIGNDHPTDYIPEATAAINSGSLPNTALLNTDKLGHSLKEYIERLNAKQHLAQLTQEMHIDEESVYELSLLKVFFLHHSFNKKIVWDSYWEKLGLVSVLQSRYPSTYLYLHQISEEAHHVDQLNRVYFIHTDYFNDLDFRKVLNLFMSGATVFYDTTHLPANFKQKLNQFLIENSLEGQNLNLAIPLRIIQLGEGRLVLFEGDDLIQQSLGKKISFWDQILVDLPYTHLPVEVEKGVELLWQTRSPSSRELGYQEVRRVSLYNPTSYRKKVSIPHHQNFAFLRIIDEFNAKVSSLNMGVEISLLPDSSVSLDFGYFE